jgi:hypothetical protein
LLSRAPPMEMLDSMRNLDVAGNEARARSGVR